MTPLGIKLRELRERKGWTQAQVADMLGLSSSYLSALEHGHKGRINRRLLHRICQIFGIIWDEAEELERLADLSDPKVKIDCSKLSQSHVELANRLAQLVPVLSHSEARSWSSQIKTLLDRKQPSPSAGKKQTL